MSDSSGDYAWIMASSALVFMMLPGISIFYGGLRSQTTVLSLIWLNMMAFSLVIIQWFLLGYSLVFSPTSRSQFIGNLHYAAFLNTMSADSYAGIREGDTPAMVFGLFQGMFAGFTIAIVTGVIAERGRLLPFLVFTLFWTTLVYDPVAYWTWNSNGWANRLGALDWAGGTPVHICSGAASLAYTLVLKHLRTAALEPTPLNGSLLRNNTTTPITTRLPDTPTPRVAETRLSSHNIPIAFLGLMLVWFGWFGFNSGSELKANMRAASTFMATNIAAASGGFAYCLCEKRKKKWSGIGFCTGAFAGLVAITPGAGYVPMWAGLVFGITSSALCYFILYCLEMFDIKDSLEEPLDICVIHGASGIWGMILTGIFADKVTAALDGTVIDGGAMSRHGIQIGYQLASGVAGFAYSFTVALLILICIHNLSKIHPLRGLKLRAKLGDCSKPLHLDNQELYDRYAYVLYNDLLDSAPPHESTTTTNDATDTVPPTAPTAGTTTVPTQTPQTQTQAQHSVTVSQAIMTSALTPQKRQIGPVDKPIPLQDYNSPNYSVQGEDPSAESSSRPHGRSGGGRTRRGGGGGGGGGGSGGEGSSSHPSGSMQQSQRREEHPFSPSYR